MRRLEDGVTTNHPILDNLGREQQANFVNEDGLYDVILDSRKPEAKQFRKWVTSEVLPSIRKHGAYMTGETIMDVLANPGNMAKLLLALKDEQDKRRELQEKSEAQAKKIEADKPKIIFADAVAESKRACLVSELAKILNQNGFKIGQNRLWAWLRQHGYICNTTNSKYLPTQKASDMGLLHLKKGSKVANGITIDYTTTTVTGKGQIYFINKFAELCGKQSSLSI